MTRPSFIYAKFCEIPKVNAGKKSGPDRSNHTATLKNMLGKKKGGKKNWKNWFVTAIFLRQLFFFLKFKKKNDRVMQKYVTTVQNWKSSQNSDVFRCFSIFESQETHKKFVIKGDQNFFGKNWNFKKMFLLISDKRKLQNFLQNTFQRILPSNIMGIAHLAVHIVLGYWKPTRAIFAYICYIWMLKRLRLQK